MTNLLEMFPEATGHKELQFAGCEMTKYDLDLPEDSHVVVLPLLVFGLRHRILTRIFLLQKSSCNTYIHSSLK